MSLNTRLLRLLNLPVFSRAEELASLVHVDTKLISELSQHPHRYYRKFTIPKRGGGRRKIKHPRKDLKAIQAWILRNILDRLAPSPVATAYVAGKGLLENVTPHAPNRYFLCSDLDDFFPSISMNRVVGLFILLGYSKKAARLLASLCTCSGNLPQGAVTSPSISNLIASKLDRRISGYTARRNITYTRYADDLTLSSNNPSVLAQALRVVTRIVRSEHFEPEARKVRFGGPKIRCYVTGLIKNSSESRFGIGREKKRRMRAIIHQLVTRGASQDNQYRTEAAVRGWMSYLRSVDMTSFQQLSSYWERLKAKSGGSARGTQ